MVNGVPLAAQEIECPVVGHSRSCGRRKLAVMVVVDSNTVSSHGRS